MTPSDEISLLYSKMRHAAFQVTQVIEERLELKSAEDYESIHLALVIELYAFQLIVMQVLAREYLASDRLSAFRDASEGGGINELVDALHPDVVVAIKDLQLVMGQTIEKYESATPLDPRARGGGDLFAPKPISGIGRFCKGVAEAIGEDDNPEYRAIAASTITIGIDKEDIVNAAGSL